MPWLSDMYPVNYSHAQKFYIKKQFDVQGYATYRLSPLFNYDKLMRSGLYEE